MSKIMMKNLKPFITSAIVCAAALAIVPNGASAATQGSLAATSTGTVTINASVPNRVQLTGLADVNFTNQDPFTAAANSQDVCVWSNTATKAYTITASGSGTLNAFTLVSGGGATVPYSVQWSTTIGAAAGTPLATGAASPTLTSAATHQTCATGVTDSASLIVGISTTDLQTMQPTVNYTGTLTLLVTPQ